MCCFWASRAFAKQGNSWIQRSSAFNWLRKGPPSKFTKSVTILQPISSRPIKKRKVSLGTKPYNTPNTLHFHSVRKLHALKNEAPTECLGFDPQVILPVGIWHSYQLVRKNVIWSLNRKSVFDKTCVICFSSGWKNPLLCWRNSSCFAIFWLRLPHFWSPK